MAQDELIEHKLIEVKMYDSDSDIKLTMTVIIMAKIGWFK